MARAWPLFGAALIACIVTAVWLARGSSGSFFDLTIVVAPVVFLVLLALLWLPATLVQLLLIERARAESIRSVMLWSAVLAFLPAAWIVTRGVARQREENREAARRSSERESIHLRVSTASDITVLTEPLSGPAEDEVISFVTNQPMSADAQIAAAARFGHSPRPLYALAMRRDVSPKALTVMYDSSLMLPGTRDASFTRRSCLATVRQNDLCLLWGRLAWAASPDLLQKMLNGPNAVIRAAAAERKAHDDSAIARSR